MQTIAYQRFPRMFTSLDYMHYHWKNYPMEGKLFDKNNHSSIILGVVANQNPWIWHYHFGLPNGKNNFNALDKRWMSISIQDTIYLWMAYMQYGFPLFRPSMNYKERNTNISFKLKRLSKRMLNIALVCCEINLSLFKFQVNNGIRNYGQYFGCLHHLSQYDY